VSETTTQSDYQKLLDAVLSFANRRNELTPQ